MTTAPLAGKGPWCTLCGEAAVFRTNSMDVLHPVVTCLRGAPDHIGCGRTVGTYDALEAEAVWTRRRRRLATSRHALHLRAGRAHPDCLTCPTDPPRPVPPNPGTSPAATR